jgi:hypothetical protein
MSARARGEEETGDTEDIGERVRAIGSDISAAVGERPYSTMAIAAGLAFAVGALWMLRRKQTQSRMETLLAHLPEMPKREALLPRRWR